jgi:hypothetical protein
VIVYAFTESTYLAWIATAAFFSLLLRITSIGEHNQRLWKHWSTEITLFSAASLLPVITEQIVTRFSSEEFYVAVETIFLGVFWLCLRFSLSILSKSLNGFLPDPSPQRNGFSTAIVAGFLILTLIIGIRHYQLSFFPITAPQFSEISTNSPFLCGISPRSQVEYSDEKTFSELVDAVKRNPEKDAATCGFLALATKEEHWADSFRDKILLEASRDRFTDPEWSIKYDQYLAAQRVYFYARVRDVFPGLFNTDQDQMIQKWFKAINHRVHKIGLVDLLYGVAFSKWPEGPYENQETGAGLLALLEANGLSDVDLSRRNRDYLSANPRGWAKRFRVSDDSAAYQPEFIENALYQSMFTGETDKEFRDRSFEWLKLLAPPDGSALDFNHLASSPIADTAYLAGLVTHNTEYTWLAARALEHLGSEGNFLDPQPGGEYPVFGDIRSPEVGSCLLYGQSGLPNQIGPFAPDKIVFRGGWEKDDLYLLLNLRFSGWHRYKATNSIIQISQNGPLVIENVNENPIGWLPTGRSLFRDKRIPRENLNGIVVGKRGLSKVLFDLTGIEGPWAQDPPFFATVSDFEPGGEFEISRTEIDNWHGVDHDRTIVFSPTGVVVIFDEIDGPEGQSSGVVWHFPGECLRFGNRIQIRSSEAEDPAEVFFLSSSDINGKFSELSGEDREGVFRAQFDAPTDGDLQIATVFLTRNWFGSEVTMTDAGLEIIKGDERIQLSVQELLSQR